MSEGPRIPLRDGIQIAVEVIRLLDGSYQRIAIAGSIRRGRADIGDCELVIIPNKRWKAATDELLTRGIFAKQLVGEKQQTRWGDKLRWGIHLESGVPVQMFTADTQNWGYKLWLHTGPGDANDTLVTVDGIRNRNGHVGILPRSLIFRDGRLWKLPRAVARRYDGDMTIPVGSEIIPVPEEEDLFAAVGLPWLPPDVRGVSIYQHYAAQGLWPYERGEVVATGHNRNFDANGRYRGIPHDAISINGKPYWPNVPPGCGDDDVPAPEQALMFGQPLPIFER
jgi:hypothetical protein